MKRTFAVLGMVALIAVFTWSIGTATIINVPANYSTISAAIAAAVANDTIMVAAGVYTDNLLIDKPLALIGADMNTTTIYPAISAPNPPGGGSLPPGASNMALVQSDDVEISGFTLDGDNPALTSGIVVGGADIDARNGVITNHNAGVYNDLSVHSVRVKNIYLRGIYASSGGTFDFHDNIVQNVKATTSSIGIFNFGGAGFMVSNTVSDCNDAISSNHSKGIQFLNNIVTNSGSGIHTDNAGDAGGAADLIQGNNISNSATNGYGIWCFAPYLAPLIENNTITNVDVGLACAGAYVAVTPQFRNNTVDGMNKPGSTGAYITTQIWGFASGNVSAIFADNSIINNTDGWSLESEAGFTMNLSAIHNVISGNTGTGVTKGTGPMGAGTFNVVMMSNWWGDISGPNNATSNPTGIGNSIADGIDYSPWWGADYRTSPHPWNWHANNSNGSTIQEGVDSASSGDVVYISAGTYNEVDITINKALSIVGDPGACGPGPSAPILQGTGAGITERGFIITPGTDNVLIDGFVVQNYGGIPNQGGGSCGTWAYGTSADPITNVTVQNCKFDHIRWAGVFFFNEGHSIFDNIQVNCNTVNMDDGTATDANEYGIECTNCKNSVISNNTVSGGFTGILMTAQALRSTPTSVTVENNTISGNTVTGSVGWTGNIGIVSIRDPVTNNALIQNITVSGNQIANSVDAGYGAYGIRAYTYGGGTFAGTMKVFNNSFTGNATKSLDNLTGILWDASGNYWGSSDTTVIRATVSSNVDYTPWMQNAGTLQNPGFSGDFSALSVDDSSPQFGNLGYVQEAVGMVSGSTINLMPGVYAGQVVIDGFAGLNLVGSGSTSTTIQAPATAMTHYFTTSANNFPIVLVENSDAVNISNLTVDGLGKGNLNYRFIGIGFHHAGGSVDNCEVKNVRNTPIDGSQHGIGIYAYNDIAPFHTVNVTQTNVIGFQKGGITLNGAYTVGNASYCNVVGYGAASFIAMNGIQIGFGGSGAIAHSNVVACCYTGSSATAAGIILYQNAPGVLLTKNIVTDCQVGISLTDGGAVLDSNTTNTTSTGPGVATYWGILGMYSVAGKDIGFAASPFAEPTTQPKTVPAAFNTTVSNNLSIGINDPGSVGIESYVYGTGNLSFSADHNSITGFGTGLGLYIEQGAALSSNLQNNYLHTNALGLENVGGTVNATFNRFTNTTNANDDHSGNTYNQNCWSDFNGAPPYHVGGTGNNVDNNPRLHCTTSLCGDVDLSGIVNVTDAVFLIDFVFTGGPYPAPFEIGDVNCDNIVNVTDVVYLLSYIFADGPAPCAACK